MSIKRITAVWDHSIQSGTTLLILLAIADNADDNGLSWPGIATLAQRARIGERAVINHLKKLEECQELHTYRRAGQHNYYIVRPGLSDEQEKTAVTKLAQILNTSEETITGQFEQPVKKRSPVPLIKRSSGGDQTITGTPDQTITRSVIRTIIEPSDDPKDSADGVSGDQETISPAPPMDNEPPTVQPHIALIDAYWAGLPGGKPIGEDYPRHVKLAVAMIDDGHITPDHITRFLRMLYTSPGDVFEYKRWQNRPIPFEEVAKLLPVWVAKTAPPAPYIQTHIPKSPPNWTEESRARHNANMKAREAEFEALPEVIAAKARLAAQKDQPS